MKLQILFCLNFILFFYLCSWTLFLRHVEIPWSSPILRFPITFFPQEIGFPMFFLPAITLSILTLQVAAFDNARFDNVSIHSSLSNSLIPFSRSSLLHYIFVKDGAKIFFLSQYEFVFSRSNLSLLPTSHALGWCYWCFPRRISERFRHLVILQLNLQT